MKYDKTSLNPNTWYKISLWVLIGVFIGIFLPIDTPTHHQYKRKEIKATKEEVKEKEGSSLLYIDCYETLHTDRHCKILQAAGRFDRVALHSFVSCEQTNFCTCVTDDEYLSLKAIGDQNRAIQDSIAASRQIIGW